MVEGKEVGNVSKKNKGYHYKILVYSPNRTIPKFQSVFQRERNLSYIAFHYNSKRWYLFIFTFISGLNIMLYPSTCECNAWEF